MRLVFDMDGVVADFEGYAVKRFGECDRSLYSLTARWPDRADEVRAFVNDHETYERLYPIAGAQMMLRALKEFGFELIYATARPGGLEMRELTAMWLRAYDIPHDDVYVVPFADKAGLVHSLGPAAVFEDAPEQIAAMRAKYLNVVTYVQPWNKYELGIRAHDWADVFYWAVGLARSKRLATLAG